jgi:hypothetical protein
MYATRSARAALRVARCLAKLNADGGADAGTMAFRLAAALELRMAAKRDGAL